MSQHELNRAAPLLHNYWVEESIEHKHRHDHDDGSRYWWPISESRAARHAAPLKMPWAAMAGSTDPDVSVSVSATLPSGSLAATSAAPKAEWEIAKQTRPAASATIRSGAAGSLSASSTATPRNRISSRAAAASRLTKKRGSCRAPGGEVLFD